MIKRGYFMNRSKFIMLVAILSLYPKIHAAENQTNFHSNNQHLKEQGNNFKKKNDTQDYEILTPTANYAHRIDEMRQFKELIGVYISVKNKIERPVHLQVIDVKRGVQFNVEPAIMIADGVVSSSNMKFMMQLSANFL